MVDVIAGATYRTRGGDRIVLQSPDKYTGECWGRSPKCGKWIYTRAMLGRILDYDHDDDLVELISVQPGTVFGIGLAKPVTTNPRLLAARRRLCQSRAS